MSSMRVASAILLVALPTFAVSSNIHAQSLSIGLRGTSSVPIGSFADKPADIQTQTASNGTLISGAKSGYGYGLDVGLGIGRLGLYGGFDHIELDCSVLSCGSEGNYTLKGVSAGMKMFGSRISVLRPFIKGGVTFNQLRGGYGTSSHRLTTDKAPGYEVGAGADISLLGLVSLAPQVRYVGQNLKVKVPGVSSPPPDGQGVNYVTFDLGLTVRWSFLSMHL